MQPHNVVVSLAASVALMAAFTHVCLVRALPTPTALHDRCTHTLVRPSSFLKRHFDLSFLKKIFKHWIPFTSTARVKMQFFLYKRDFPECGREIVTDDDDTLAASGFDAEHPTRIIIHGWMSQSKGSFNRAVKNAYLSLTQKPQQNAANVATNSTPSHATLANATADSAYAAPTSLRNASDYNVIVVDWSLISSNFNYFGVVEMIEDLGYLLAEFVRYLHKRTGLHYDDVYLIGHSLGAQIAGSTGKQVQPFRFNTIYALDPAGPKFRDLSEDYRIDPSDASYVESIHTSNSLGFQLPVGHASFYPNYGHDQKKCYFYGCSHSRAYDYFAESITSAQGFWGSKCERESEDVWIMSNSDAEFRMGGEPSTPKNGTFYVKTSDEPPYALGRRKLDGVQVEVFV